MGDDNYVRELKQGAVGAKLPTMLDLNPNNEANFSSRIETPTARNYLVKDEETGKPVVRKEKTPQQIASEIATRIRTLHYEGRHLDEIYEVLESEGYEYSVIEPIFMDYLNKLRPAVKGQSPQGQGNFQVSSGPARITSASPAPTPAQMGTMGSVPMQRPASAARANAYRDPNMQQASQTCSNLDQGMEVVDINAMNPPSTPAREEVPTNDPGEISAARQLPGFEGQSRQAPVGEADSLGGSDFAPLFVKVGKYRETLEDLSDLENYLRAMSRLFELVEELENVRVMNIQAIDKMHKKALVTASKLSSGLLKPKGMSLEGTRESDIELNKLGDVIGDLSKELTMLKKEVDKLNRLE